jgi:hypothetical protein
MDEDGLPKPATTTIFMLRILIYAALLLLVLMVGFFPIASISKINLKMIYSPAPDH